MEMYIIIAIVTGLVLGGLVAFGWFVDQQFEREMKEIFGDRPMVSHDHPNDQGA